MMMWLTVPRRQRTKPRETNASKLNEPSSSCCLRPPAREPEGERCQSAVTMLLAGAPGLDLEGSEPETYATILSGSKGQHTRTLPRRNV